MKIIGWTNLGYIPYSLNFVATAIRARINPRDIRFYCTDEESASVLRAVGAETVIEGSGEYPKTFIGWESPGWQQLIWGKLDILTREIDRGEPFLYMDSDIALYHDPRPYLEPITGLDFVAQGTCRGGNASFFNVGAGLMYIFPTQKCRELFARDKKYEGIYGFYDEDLINARVQFDHTIRWLALPIQSFPDGSYRGAKQTHKRFLMHYNWAKNDEKYNLMRVSGDWLVSEAPAKIGR